MKNQEVLQYVADNWFKKTVAEISRNTKLSEKTIRNYAKAACLPSKKSNLFQEVLTKNNFSPPKWKDGWLKTEEASIRIVNTSEVPFEEIKEDMIKEMKKHSPRYKKIKRTKMSNHLLVIDIADLHLNKLSLKEETGDEYNLKIAIERANKAIDEILTRAKPYNIEKILFVIGNDILNTDNNKATTAGTSQSMETEWWRAFKIARKLYVEIIEKLLTKCDLHIMHNPSNHDWYSGFMLADAVYCWFHKHPNITWDITNHHRKYFKYGQNLIGTSHGDGAKVDDMPMLMATEAKQLWSQTNYRYIYLHHIHHKKHLKYLVGSDKQQITIEYMRSPSGADPWHSRNGYHAPKSIEGFIHDKENGQVARITVNF